MFTKEDVDRIVENRLLRERKKRWVQADRQKRDRAQVGAEILPGGEDRRDIKEGRQEQEEHDLRVELDLRKDRHEAEDKPAEDEQDRVGDLDPVGECRERSHRDEQDEDRL